MMKRILISGVSGLMGGTFAKMASEHYDVYGIYSRHRVTIPNIQCIPLNLSNVNEVICTLNSLHPEIIVHFAAATDVDWCETHRPQAEEINVKSVQHLASWAKDNHVRIVYLSTDSVFDGVQGSYREGDNVNPINYYAATKWMAEKIVRGEVENHLIIRANIYGFNIQDKLSFSEWAIHKIRQRVPFKGFVDVIFTPILVNTLSELMIQLMATDASGTFHIGSHDAISKYDFIKEIAAIFDLESDFVEKESVANVNFDALRPKNTSLLCSKAIDAGVRIPTIASDLTQLRKYYDHGYHQTLKTWNHPNQ